MTFAPAPPPATTFGADAYADHLPARAAVRQMPMPVPAPPLAGPVPSFSKLRNGDWQNLLRLANEAAELPAGSEQRREHLLLGLARLTGGCGGVLFEIDPTVPIVELVPLSGVDCVGMLAGFEPVVAEYFTEGMNAHDEAGQLCRRLSRSVQPHGFVDLRRWHRSPHYERIFRRVGYEHQLYSLMFDRDRAFALATVRSMGEPAYGERDLQVMDAFNALCPAAWGMGRAPLKPAPYARGNTGAVPPRTPSAAAVSTLDGAADGVDEVKARVAALPPRLQLVLERLLAGDGSKQVAAATGLTRNTVLEYTKQLYRRMNVNGRGELLALFVRR